MIMDQAMHIMEKLVDELKESDPGKRDHFIKIAVSLFDISTEAMKTSPEFRRGFAKAHSEFLKYPECRETLEQSMEAYKTYLQ